MSNKMTVKADRTIYSYVVLQDVAEYELEMAKNTEEGRFYNCLTAMLYSAFCLEAYLNHLGNLEMPNWNKVERKSPMEKLNLLVEKRSYSPNFNERPFKTFGEIFEFRKKIVHGKTEHLKTEEIRDGEVSGKPPMLMTLWEGLTTLEMATCFVEDSASMISKLHPIFGFTTNPFWTQWKTSWELKPFQKNP